MNEERLIDLETRLAYQEDTLRVLNDIIAGQSRQIEVLERRCRDLGERLARVADSALKGSPADEVPPHY